MLYCVMLQTLRDARVRVRCCIASLLQALRVNLHVLDVVLYHVAGPHSCTFTCRMLYCIILQALRVARSRVGCYIVSYCRPSELHVHVLDVVFIMLQALTVARSRVGCCIVSSCRPSELHVHVLDVVLYHVAGPQSCTCTCLMTPC
jgi:hypothetical protein